MVVKIAQTTDFWQADGKRFAAADEHRLILEDALNEFSVGSDVTKNVPLHISPVKPEDSGRYKCTARSVVGAHSAFVTITVLCKCSLLCCFILWCVFQIVFWVEFFLNFKAPF